ncbi:ABC transporter permease [Clostridium tagluense]|nr:ABC transporter permease [Clostridium tagluense]MCB2309525.1 ABC transporter permease [Clostridium tagluense]MCB2333823.1 ABC transporter permease [Clostridium tagluense]MCB2362617.1 ABC transporter permease [Clostridium tagluense]
MELYKSEFERIWKRRLTWICFILIPLSIAGASKYYLSNNYSHAVTSAEFVSFGNYPFMIFQKVLVTLFNIFTMLFVCMCVTEEYRSGEIRLVMIRGYSFLEIYFAKVAAIITTMLIFFLIFFLLSTVWGYFAATRLDKVMLFYHSNSVTILKAFLYSGKYYALGFLTTMAMLSVFMVFAVKCKTVTGAMGCSIAVIIGGLVFSEVIIYFGSILGKNLITHLYFSTITKIQHLGICMVLSEKPTLAPWIIIVLISHIIFFGGIACRIFTKEDHLI